MTLGRRLVLQGFSHSPVGQGGGQRLPLRLQMSLCGLGCKWPSRAQRACFAPPSYPAVLHLLLLTSQTPWPSIHPAYWRAHGAAPNFVSLKLKTCSVEQGPLQRCCALIIPPEGAADLVSAVALWRQAGESQGRVRRVEKLLALWSRAPCRAKGSKQRAGSRMTLCFHGHCASSEEILSESMRLLKMDPLEGPKDRTGGRLVHVHWLRGQALFFDLILPMPDKFLQRENAILAGKCNSVSSPQLAAHNPTGKDLALQSNAKKYGWRGAGVGSLCVHCLPKGHSVPWDLSVP